MRSCAIIPTVFSFPVCRVLHGNGLFRTDKLVQPAANTAAGVNFTLHQGAGSKWTNRDAPAVSLTESGLDYGDPLVADQRELLRRQFRAVPPPTADTADRADAWRPASGSDRQKASGGPGGHTPAGTVPRRPAGQDPADDKNGTPGVVHFPGRPWS